LAILVGKTFFLVIVGFRKLKVESVTVSNSFLLANGIVIVQWQVTNALWIRVDRRWMGSRGSQVLVLPSKPRQRLVIQIQGLFSSYKKEFDINPLAMLKVRRPRLPEWTFKIKDSRLRPVFSPKLRHSLSVTIGTIRPILPPMPLGIPPIPTIQTDNKYETRVLHHP
jgi:hypothetical protein